MSIESLPKAGEELMGVGPVQKSFDLRREITLGRIHGPSPILNAQHSVGMGRFERKDQKRLRRCYDQIDRERALGENNVRRSAWRDRHPQRGNGAALFAVNLAGNFQSTRAHRSKTEVVLAAEK